jgi:hypothetical protein
MKKIFRNTPMKKNKLARGVKNIIWKKIHLNIGGFYRRSLVMPISHQVHYIWIIDRHFVVDIIIKA